MTKKRLITWGIIFVISLIAFSISEYHKKNNIPEEQKEVFTVYSNIDGMEDSINNFLVNNAPHLKKKYRVQMTSDSNEADTVVTTNFSDISKEISYETVAYTPLIALFDDNNNSKLEEYLKNGLIQSSSGKISHTHSDELTINVSKLLNAVIENKNWSDFGGDEIPISIYCPSENTVDGKLFNEFILIAANNGVYPKNETELSKANEKSNLFFASPYVQRINMIDMLSKLGTFDNEIYFCFESDFLKANVYKLNSLISVCYPDKTVIREVYYQSKTDTAIAIQEDENGFLLSYYYGFKPSQCSGIMTGSTYRYRSEYNPSHRGIQFNVNIRKSFPYTEIPKPF